MNTAFRSLASTLALALVLALPLAAAIPQPVKTAAGPVAGAPSADGSVLAFKGIPYAAPPVGALRWRAPQPAAAWTAVRSADRFGASCMQNIVTERKPWTYEFMAHNEISEDCLYLNVWTPAKSAGEKLPVYVWIHGGGYVEGSGQVPVYDGANLARRGVVVVTINYRLGVFGFLAHPELTKEAGRSGNYGSLDQVAALQWVQKNIAAFGGDPGRVTIGGQSAGASGVHNLVASPLAKGLFHRAIAESGSSYPTTNASGRMAAAEQVGAAFGAAYGATSLQALRALPATALMTRPGNAPASSFRPVIDGHFLPADPAEIYAQGRQNDVPELTGLNLDERSSEAEYGAARQAAAREAGLVSMHLWAEHRAAKSRHAAYTYYWTHAEPGPDSARYGAFHTSEVPYVFNTLDQSQRPWTDQDRKLAELLGAYWVNFMKNGDPNGAGLPTWPKFTAASATTMELGDRTGPRAVAEPDRLAFWRRRAQDAVRAPVASVTGGDVQGATGEGGGAVFKGIPFAQPPVGALRWREPQRVQPWNGVRQAMEFGPACPQNNTGWNKLAAERSQEDCLYLNVWAPEWPSRSRKAVMVWIHGGANTGGSAMGAGGIEPPFDGASLARHGVVVVTLNYRLNLLGFVGHPELTAESPNHASGGYGLLDQVAALRWVHDNIATFGGDPGNVTVFGQSAGGQNTTLLVASPLARGLIHKAIAQSGTPMISDKRLQTPAQTEQLGTILARVLKAPATGAIAHLRTLPVEQIVAAMPDLRAALPEAKLILDVGMDGYVVPQFTPNVYRTGRQPAIPMIIGSTAMDAPGFRATDATPEQRKAAVQARIAASYGSYPDLVTRASKAYGVGDGDAVPAGNPRHGPIDQQYAVDHSMRCEAVALAGWHSQLAPTYHYEFSAGTPSHPPVHSSELDFVFGYLRDQAADATLGKLSEQMQQYWSNFAKTGDPNGPGLPRWGKYDARGKAFLDFGNEGPQAKADLRGGACPIYVEKLTRDVSARQ